MGKRVAGTCYIKIDDQQITIQGSVEVPFSPFMREAVESLDNSGGFYSEKGVVPYVKATAIADPAIDRTKIANSTSMTITTELANGWVYVLSGAYLAGETQMKADEGTIEYTFNGEKGTWLS